MNDTMNLCSHFDGGVPFYCPCDEHCVCRCVGGSCPATAPVAALVERPDVGPVDVVKKHCECPWCKGGDHKPPPPMPMILPCPECGYQHVDTVDISTGIDWSKKSHFEHLCGHCGFLWTPASIPTVGVKEL